MSDYTDSTKKTNKRPRRRQAATNAAIRDYLYRQAIGRYRDWTFKPERAMKEGT